MPFVRRSDVTPMHWGKIDGGLCITKPKATKSVKYEGASASGLSLQSDSTWKDKSGDRRHYGRE
jgi:hypothetical protein